ncbi:MAG: pyridoxal phosphate-dependent aminotransferase [Lachnospiraceae bacterium]|nr:pyridoxal phosphate-dependent aminotransferase [Lachnospiraceae bacterium]
MINPKYKEMLNAKNQIRELAGFAQKRGAEIGYENVFDYSLGNPSVPVPERFNDVIRDFLKNREPVKLHGYSPNPGLAEVRDLVAASLSRRFSLPYKREHIFMTSGAAGAIAHAARAVSCPGEEIITFAPFFPEYVPYINETGAILKVVPADTTSFQINFEEFDKLLNEKTAAILINTPNNPSGIVYSEETIKKLAALLREKEGQYGHPIYIISDEPYREIVFDGKKAPCISALYENTVMCYSFSKSLSIPGERIGYVAACPNCADAELIIQMCVQISRGTGHNCPSSLIQLAVGELLDETSDLSVYETNMNILYDKLTELGFEVVRPGGTFYIFPKAPIADAKEFCEEAKKYDLILVPSDTFGVEGYFRMAYCIQTEKVERSLAALEKLAKAYHMI